MARPHPLDEDPSLNRARFGHTPALWLLLPLLLGAAIDTAWRPDMGLLLSGAAACLFGFWIFNKKESVGLIFILSAGIWLGCGWHQAKLFPQTKIEPPRGHLELSVLVLHASPQSDESKWSGRGIITEKGNFFRRRISLAGKGLMPISGGEFKLSGWLSAIPENPEGFDAWIASQGCTLKLQGAQILGTLEAPSAFAIWCHKTQKKLETWLRALPWDDPAGGSLLAATLLGRTALLPVEAKLNFAATGTLHLFAISGLHIAGMAAALLWLTRKLRLPEKPLGVLILILLWTYVQVTGASPSSLRAWIMAAFIWAGQVSERRTPLLQSLSLAGATTLIFQPEACNDPGFQLSYLAVLSIILMGAPAAQLLSEPTLAEKLTPLKNQGWHQRTRSKIRKFMVSGLCISTAATLAGLPLTITHFQSASIAGIFVNLILVPLSEIPLVCGMLSLFLSPWDSLLPIAQWLNGIGVLILNIMTEIARTFAQIPGLNYALKPKWSGSGPLCALILIGCIIYQAETRSVKRLFLCPFIIVATWVLVFVN